MATATVVNGYHSNGHTLNGVNGRSRSPGRNGASSTALTGPVQKGHAVQFFLEVDPADAKAAMVSPKQLPGCPVMLKSHCWVDGTMAEAYDPATFRADDQKTWPLVAPRPNVMFCDKLAKRKPEGLQARRVRHVRLTSGRPPLLSLVFVRWGGQNSPWMDSEERNDGDWGDYGAPTSDQYMAALVKDGLWAHPRLNGTEEAAANFEILNIFVRTSDDVWNMGANASAINSTLLGLRKTSFWMVWPAEWEDFDDPDYACYIDRQAVFGAQRALQATGIRSGFPHPGDQFELITSKTWMATLSLHPGAHLPAGTLVDRSSVMIDPERAAKQALLALEHIRRINPHQVDEGDPPCPSEINKDGIKKGVVKLGWSWENRFVSDFVGPQQLQAKLTEMLTQEGLTASQCIVQEWVDFDFEMRLYFLPAGEWTADAVPHQPTRIECNAWGASTGKNQLGQSRASFSKVSHDAAIKRWEGDVEAWEDGKRKATHISQLLLAWLLSANAEPVPMIRLDFMMKRTGPGKARAVFGEFCEMGACCLGWKEGPPTIWRAALDAALR
eukprot:TRINITY_DN80693_c0_g1_i1.p1 TRINITY_DN80693_c0_g1~~TRINITY_DN80693_c0_g1_i1.p1  ORF type:complete len:555 (-),score=117.54 TRINITY_DN80693_c0_g1_i1:39-1703(-)